MNANDHFIRSIRPRQSGGISLSLLMALVILASWAIYTAVWKAGTTETNIRYEHVTYTYVYGGSSILTYLNLSDIIAYVCICLLCIRGRDNVIPTSALCAIVTTVILCVFWIMYDLQDFIDQPTSLLEPTSPLNLLVCMGVFAGARPGLWKWVNSTLPIVAFGSSMISLLYSVHMDTYARFTDGSPMVFHTVLGLWTGAYCLFRVPPNRIARQAFFTIPVLICLYVSIFAQARGWSLQALLVIFVRYMYLNLRGGKRLFSIWVSIAIVCGIVGIGALYFTMSNSAAIQGLKDRLGEDTRSPQYNDFFRQIPLSGLVTGMGPSAGYNTEVASNYKAVDNQLLFLMFKFGLLALLAYGTLIISPALRAIFLRLSAEQRAAPILVLQWLLALLGISTFLAIRPDPANYLIAMLAGRCFWLLSQAKRERTNGSLSDPSSLPPPGVIQLEAA